MSPPVQCQSEDRIVKSNFDDDCGGEDDDDNDDDYGDDGDYDDDYDYDDYYDYYADDEIVMMRL